MASVLVVPEAICSPFGLGFGSTRGHMLTFWPRFWGDRGEVGRRRHGEGRDGGAKEDATRAQQRRRDGGA